MPLTPEQIREILIDNTDLTSIVLINYGSAVQLRNHPQAAQQSRIHDAANLTTQLAPIAPTPVEMLAALVVGHPAPLTKYRDYNNVVLTAAQAVRTPADRALAIWLVAVGDEISDIINNGANGGTRNGDLLVLEGYGLEVDELAQRLRAMPVAAIRQAREDIATLATAAAAGAAPAELPAVGGVGQTVSLATVNKLIGTNIHTGRSAAIVAAAPAGADRAAALEVLPTIAQGAAPAAGATPIANQIAALAAAPAVGAGAAGAGAGAPAAGPPVIFVGPGSPEPKNSAEAVAIKEQRMKVKNR